jgi:CRP-like cAMP-binding protein
LLKELDDESLATLADSLESLVLPEGQALFCAGDPGDGLLLLAAGSLTLSHPTRGECGEVAAGGCLGAASLVTGGERELSAVAQSSCELWWLSQCEFKTLIDCAPRVACQLLEAVTRELAACARALACSLPLQPDTRPDRVDPPKARE